MSSNMSKQRLIRAVRLLPGTVRVTRGKMEDIAPDDAEAGTEQDDRVNKSALDMAEEEVKKLRSELLAQKADLAASRGECEQLKARRESELAELERERVEFLEKSERDAAELKESSRVKGYEEGHDKGYSQGLLEAGEEMKREYEGKFSRALSLLDETAKSLADSRERLAERHAS
ncbi:MAG: hypothetical protein LBK91_01715, partial [Synergistaceae bacterium]|nr:hypothetical protein [Synergistaceae bacterium]